MIDGMVLSKYHIMARACPRARHTDPKMGKKKFFFKNLLLQKEIWYYGFIMSRGTFLPFAKLNIL
jgi:hypothetical protein